MKLYRQAEYMCCVTIVIFIVIISIQSLSLVGSAQKLHLIMFHTFSSLSLDSFSTLAIQHL